MGSSVRQAAGPCRIAPHSLRQAVRLSDNAQRDRTLQAHAAAGMQATADLPAELQKIVGAFQMVPDPMARYKQLLFFASKLDPLPDEYHTPEHRVPGCVSQVWVRATLEDGKMFFRADSDSQLTKGLAALLVQGLSNSAPQAILAMTPDFIEMLGLKQNLMPSRNNGFLNMFKLMQRKTLELAAEDVKKGNGSVNGVETPESYPNGVSESSSATPVYDSIHKKLMAGLSPVALEVVDESAQHKGHAGAQDTSSSSGETHFRITAVSPEFDGLSRLQRHRKVYELLVEEMSGPVHAMAMDLKSPSEDNMS